MRKKPHARSIFAVTFISLFALVALAGVQPGGSESLSSYEEQAVNAAYFQWHYADATTVAFTALGPDIANYTWSSADGLLGYGKTTTHPFDPGNYTVTLTTTRDGDTTSSARNITVSGDPPVADFTWEPETPTTQDEVQFWDASVDPHQEIRNWTWQFGDDHISYYKDPTHTYADNGLYDVQLTIYDGNHTCLDSVTKQVFVFNVPPTANFYWTKRNGAIYFNGSYSKDDGRISTWEWDFGDGNGSYVESPTHIYQDEGAYPVTLTVTDDDGETSTITKTVDTTNFLPHAAAFIHPVEATIKTDVIFNDSSVDHDGTIINRTWDFGDGTKSHASNTTHRYNAKGSYTVTLTVIDDGHAYNATTREIEVINLPPEAVVSWDPVYPAVNETVTFFNYSISPGGVRQNTTDLDGTITNQTWLVDNQTVGYGSNITHAFSSTGIHTVTLRVTDDSGDTNESTHSVHVADIYVDDDQSEDWYDHSHVRTIQEGVNNASAGNLIHVLEGIYAEHIVVNKTVTLAGNDAIVDAGAGTACTVTADATTLHELTVTNATQAVNVTADNVTITDCHVADSASGIRMQGSYALISSNTFEGQGQGTGAAVHIEGSHTRIVYNTFTQTVDSVVIVDGRNHTVEGNSFTGAIRAVQVQNAEDCAILGNTFRDNHPFAIDVAAPGCRIADNVLSDNGRAVILRGDDGIMENNTLTSNTIGVEVEGTDNTIRLNTISNNGEAAVVLSSSSGTEISDCSLTGNPIGIEARSSGRYAATAIHNVAFSTILENAISLHDTAAYISGCTFADSTHSLYVNHSSDVTIQSCTFAGGDTAIFINDSAPTITGCTISAYTTAIASSGQQATIADSRFHNNSVALLMEGDDTTVTGCTIKDNQHGISVHAAHNLTITTTTFSGNTHGVFAEDDTDTTLQNTSFANNTYAVALNGSHSPTVADSLITDSETALALTDTTGCRVLGTHIRRNALAVTVLASSHNTFDSNNLTDNHLAFLLSRAPYNTLRNNSFAHNDYAIDLDGRTVSHYYQEINASNEVNGQPVRYIVNQSNVTMGSQYGYLAFVSCHTVTVTGAATQPNGEGLLLVDVHTFTVEQSTFAHSMDGAVLFASSRGTMAATNCSDNAGDGIIMTSGTHNISITASTITGNQQRGINLYRPMGGAGNVHISDSHIADNWLGVNIENTRSNTIENLTLSGHLGVAIRLYKSADMYIGNVTLQDNTDGLEITRSSATLYKVIARYHVAAITVTDGTAAIHGGTFHDNEVGILAIRAAVTLRDAALYNHSTGVTGDNATVSIASTSFDNNARALHAVFSAVTVDNCSITNNTYGVLLDHVEATSIVNCTGTRRIANNTYGLSINHSVDVVVVNCSLLGNENAVMITASWETSIDDCRVYNNTDAITVIDANDTSILDSLLHHNVHALDIHSNNTTITRCSFWKNMYGVRILHGLHNNVYHNNFAYNMEQASDAGANNTWDNGYPAGGNYWSNYAGTDHRRGPAQNQSGSDGIGDIPLPIAGGSAADTYPLMDVVEDAAHIPNSPPQAAFFLYPPQPQSGQEIDFIDQSTDPNGNSDIASWHWNFGDGNTSTIQHPAHVYEHPGNYTVTLTVTDSQGANTSRETNITVANTPPVAHFTMSPRQASVGETIQFTDGSNDTNGDVISWNWTFGDGNTSAMQDPSHRYSDSGTYTVTLTVTDDDGAADTYTADMVIAGTKPMAAFSAVPLQPKSGEPVSFTDLSTDDGSIVTWHWDFGDGNASAAQNPSHEYEKTGTYTVTLTVWDDDGGKNTTTKTITVGGDNDTPGFALPLLFLAMAATTLAIFRRRGKV